MAGLRTNPIHAGFPPLDADTPAIPITRIPEPSHSKGGRSCSPGLTYVISCRDLALEYSAYPVYNTGAGEGWSPSIPAKSALTRISRPGASAPAFPVPTHPHG